VIEQLKPPKHAFIVCRLDCCNSLLSMMEQLDVVVEASRTLTLLTQSAVTCADSDSVSVDDDCEVERSKLSDPHRRQNWNVDSMTSTCLNCWFANIFKKICSAYLIVQLLD